MSADCNTSNQPTSRRFRRESATIPSKISSVCEPSDGKAEEASESEPESEELEPVSPPPESWLPPDSSMSIVNTVLRSKPFPSDVTMIVTSHVLVGWALDGEIRKLTSAG